MKKSLFYIIAATLLISAIGFTVFANGESRVVISGSHETASAGETVEVLVNLDSNSGFCGLNLYFTYTEGLEFVSLTNSVDSLMCTHDVTTVWDGAKDYTGTGTLALLTFKVPEDAAPGTKYDVDIYFIEAYNSALKNVSGTVSAGSITVEDDTPAVNSDLVISGSHEIAGAGETVEMLVNIDSNSGFCGLNLYFSYTEGLEFISLTNSVDSLMCTHDVTTVWDATKDYTGTGTLAVLKFKVPEDAAIGTKYNVDIYFVEAFDSSLNPVSATVSDGSVTVGAAASALSVETYLDCEYEVSGRVVTVSSDAACKVGYKSGVRYIAINAVANSDGSYSFTAPEGVSEVLLVLKGDANLDGRVTAADIARINASKLGKTAIGADAIFAGDVDRNSAVNDSDIDTIKNAVLRVSPLEW